MQSYSLFDSVWSVAATNNNTEGVTPKEVVVGSPLMGMMYPQPNGSAIHTESSPKKINPKKSSDKMEHPKMVQHQQQIRIMQNPNNSSSLSCSSFSPVPDQIGMPIQTPVGMVPQNLQYNGMQHMPQGGMNSRQMMQQQSRMPHQSQLSNQIQMQQQMPPQSMHQQMQGGMPAKSIFQPQQMHSNRMYSPNGDNGMAHSPNTPMHYTQGGMISRQKQQPIGVPIQASMPQQNSMFESMSPGAVNYGVIGQSPRPSSVLHQGSPLHSEAPPADNHQNGPLGSLLAGGNLSPHQAPHHPGVGAPHHPGVRGPRLPSGGVGVGKWSTATLQDSPKQNAGENGRSIWSSNFALGQGALSPLEQLLQEQRRQQRPK